MLVQKQPVGRKSYFRFDGSLKPPVERHAPWPLTTVWSFGISVP